jgi:hypothetical protein
MFVTLAVLDVLSVAGLGLVALAMLRSGRAAAARVSPALSHARRTADAGKRLALKGRNVTRESVDHARALVARIQKRIATTRHLIRELNPPAEVDTRAMVRSAEVTVARGREWAGRLSRLRRAGQAASSKNRTPHSQL